MLSKKSTKAQSAGVDVSLDQLAGPKTLRGEIKARWKLCTEFYKDWNKAAKEDYQFALGDQWTDADRQALKNESRPCLTFNRIRPMINIIAGYQRENSARIKVGPEGGEDRIFSEVMDKAVRFIDKVSDLTFVLGYQFDDGCYVGRSYIEAFKTYDNDPIRGELNFELRTPYEIMPDPEFKGYDLNKGCKYVFKTKKYSKSKLIELFPDKKSIIQGFKEDNDELENNMSLNNVEGMNDDYGNNPNQTTVISKGEYGSEPEFDDDIQFTLKEYWHYKLTDKFFVIEAGSEDPKRFDTQKEADAFAAKQGAGIKAIKRQVKIMWATDYVCGVILQDVESPLAPDYTGYPFFRFLADWAPNAEKEEFRTQGIVRPLKDPQREKNKSKSQALHILNTQANSGWIADDDALSPQDFTKLEEMGSKPGLVVKKKRNSELREITPKAQNQGFVQREMQADEEFKQIANINPDLLGLQDNSSTSGRAMQTRIKQAILALSRLFTNYRYTKKILGNFILAMMPAIVDEKKLARIVGTQYMQQNNISEGTLAAYLQMVKDDRYDVIVAEADSQASERYETFQELLELAKTGAPIPPDLFIDYMDMPNSQEVKQRIQQYMQQMQQAAAAAATAKSGAPAQ